MRKNAFESAASGKLKEHCTSWCTLGVRDSSGKTRLIQQDSSMEVSRYAQHSPQRSMCVAITLSGDFADHLIPS